MEPVTLDPRTYRGTYKLLGGQPSLDLVNTVSWPGRPREHDWFDPVENVIHWAVATGLLDPEAGDRLAEWVGCEPSRAARELGKVRRIRSAVSEVLVPYVRGEVPSTRAVMELNRHLTRASGRRHLDARTLTWTFREPTTLEHVLAPAVLNAAEVLMGVDPHRLRHCPDCDWVFQDTTRNGRRTWCDMADCGSRAKARRHYQRHRL
jgi:predicted RNA-binding Zn ribbon-like protein